MKISKFSVATILALGGLLVLGQFANAQENKGDGKAEDKGGKRGAAMQERMKKMETDLGLSDDQKTKFEAIMKEQAEKMRPIFQDQSMSREDKMAKMKELREANTAKIKEILTAEQKEKYDKILAEQQARFKKKDQ